MIGADSGLEPAFPHTLQKPFDRLENVEGLSQRAFAAIHLKVPDSGVDWLDAMILSAKRDDLAAAIVAAATVNAHGLTPGSPSTEKAFAGVSLLAYELADAMLATRARQ